MSGDWAERAACLGHENPDLWHPVGGGTTKAKAQAIRDAKEICGRCPVKAECLAEAIEKGHEGIWGGTTDQERNAIAQKRNATSIAQRFPNRPNPPTWSERCGKYSGVSRHRSRKEQFCQPCREARNEYESERKKRQRAERRQETNA